MELAEYPPAVARQIMETIFTNGLHPEISLAIKSSLLPLTSEQKISAAQRYWTARRPIGGHHTVHQVLTPELQKIMSNTYAPQNQIHAPQENPWNQLITRDPVAEMAAAIRPAQGN